MRELVLSSLWRSPEEWKLAHETEADEATASSALVTPRRRLQLPAPLSDFEVIRDPLWDNIRLDGPPLALLDTAPCSACATSASSATPSWSIPAPPTPASSMRSAPITSPGGRSPRSRSGASSREVPRAGPDGRAARGAAARHRALSLLPRARGSRLSPPRAARRRAAGHGEPLASELRQSSACPGLARDIGALITGQSTSPLKGLISGSLDLDKIDYLSRDARMCGVPYGAVDVDRLLASLTLIEVAPGRFELGRAGEGHQRARVAALRQVPDVPQRLLAPRGAERHLHVQAGGARGGGRRGAHRRSGWPTPPTTGSPSGSSPPTRPASPARCAAAGSSSGRSTCPPARCLPRRDPWTRTRADLLERVEDRLARGMRPGPGRAAARLPQQPFHAGGGPPAPDPERHRRAAHRAGPRRASSDCPASPRSSTKAPAGCGYSPPGRSRTTSPPRAS